MRLPFEKHRPSSASGPSRSILFTCTLLLLALLFGEMLHRRHSKLLTETGALLILGALANSLVWLLYGEPLQVTQDETAHDIMYFGLLPPIIFEAGFSMRKRGFFVNIFPIALFAVVGTLVSILATGALLYAFRGYLATDLTLSQAMLFGALISSTDPVATLGILRSVNAPPLLFDLIFGESALNDALSIVLFNAFRDRCREESDAAGWPPPPPRPHHEPPHPPHHLKIPPPPPHPPFSPPSRAPHAPPLPELDSMWGKLGLQLLVIVPGSLGVGLGLGLASAALTKQLRMSRMHRPHVELLIVILVALGSYSAAESAELSGILALFLCSIVVQHYTLHNLSDSAQRTARTLFATFAALGEAGLSLLIGVAVVDFAHPDYVGDACWDWAWVGLSIPVLLVARACNIFPLSAVANSRRWRRSKRWWARRTRSMRTTTATARTTTSSEQLVDPSASGSWYPEAPRASRGHLGSAPAPQLKYLPACITLRMQTVMWSSGLRGAVSFALAMTLVDQRQDTQVVPINIGNVIVSTTLAVVCFTNLLMAPVTGPLIACLRLATPKHDAEVAAAAHATAINPPNGAPNGGERERERGSPLKATRPWIHSAWRRLDEEVLKPLFGGRPRSHTFSEEDLSTAAYDAMTRPALGGAARVGPPPAAGSPRLDGVPAYTSPSMEDLTRPMPMPSPTSSFGTGRPSNDFSDLRSGQSLPSVPEPAERERSDGARVAEPSARIAELSARIAEPSARIAEPSARIAEPSARIAEPRIRRGAE